MKITGFGLLEGAFCRVVCSLQWHKLTRTRFEAQVLQGFLTEFSNNLNDCIKFGIRILEVGEGLLVVTDRYGEQLSPGKSAT